MILSVCLIKPCMVLESKQERSSLIQSMTICNKYDKTWLVLTWSHFLRNALTVDFSVFLGHDKPWKFHSQSGTNYEIRQVSGFWFKPDQHKHVFIYCVFLLHGNRYMGWISCFRSVGHDRGLLDDQKVQFPRLSSLSLAEPCRLAASSARPRLNLVAK